MEKRQFTFASQKNRWGFTILSVILFIMLGPFASVLAFLPRMMTTLPILLVILLGYVGIVSTVLCTAVVVMYAMLLFGIYGAIGALIFLVPPLIGTAVLSERNMPFFRSCAISGMVMLLCEYLVLAIISMVTGQDAVSAVMQLFVDFFNENSLLSTSLMDVMMQNGLISINQAASSISQLSAGDRVSILQSFIRSMDQLLRLEVPLQIATGAVSMGLLGQFLMRYAMRTKGVKVDCPPFRTWRIPDGFGRVMLITVAALYLLSLIGRGMDTMFTVVSGVFEQLLTLQGIAAVCYSLHQNGKSRRMQFWVFILGYFILGIAAVIVGIIDQTFDFTHRRAELKKLDEQRRRDAYDPKAENRNE